MKAQKPGAEQQGAKAARFYVPQLDGLRFFAFLLVFVHHGPRFGLLTQPGSTATKVLELLFNFGWAGVDLFLVLSAFLITSLLLLEHDRHGTISLRGFYVRRMLRIWPLYYLMTAIGFFLLPWLSLFAHPIGSPEHARLMNHHLLAYLTLFGNYSSGIHSYPTVGTLAHLWTVTLEEQFYIVWPLILSLVWRRRRWIWPLLAVLLVGTISLRLGLRGQRPHPYIWTNTLTRLDPLIVGIVLAVWRHARPATSSAILAAVKLAVGMVLVIAVSWGPLIQVQSKNIGWQFLTTAVGFGLILDASLTQRRNAFAWVLTRRPLVWLGKLTYGLYVYHVLGLQIAGEVVSFLHGRGIATSRSSIAMLHSAIGLAITIAIAAESYRLFESFFLRLKDRFARVKSGEAGEPAGAPPSPSPSKPDQPSSYVPAA